MSQPECSSDEPTRDDEPELESSGPVTRTDDPSPERSEPHSRRAMTGHRTDVIGFFFGVLFLVCAAAAIVLRTVPLGESPDDGVALAAAAVLLIAGAVGIVGSLRNHHRRAAIDTSAAGVVDVADDGQPPKTWTT